MANKSMLIKPVAAAVSVAFVSSFFVSTAAVAAENPFDLSDLDAGYMLAGEDKDKHEEGKCGEDKEKHEEGKCGEGKCGDDKEKYEEGEEKGEEGSCGEEGEEKGEEGSCGEDKGEEGKCGG